MNYLKQSILWLTDKYMNKKRVWLITGCSKGFGRELVKVAAERGELVYGTVRKVEEFGALKSINRELVNPVLMDVTNQEQVRSAVQKVITEHGKIDILVNNAGFGCMGPLEEVPMEEINRQFDTNIYGPIRLMKAVLPHMRKQRSGFIMNISSIAGLQGYPGLSYYNASKFALEGMTEALFWEVKNLGIRVTVVEPGPFRTEFAGTSARYNDTALEDYKDSAQKNMENLRGYSGSQLGDPVKAAIAMYDLSLLEKPPLHLLMGSVAYERARDKFSRLLKEMEDFEYLGLPTDYEK